MTIGDAELHAYLDGELDAEDARVVENWLAENPEEAVRLEGMKHDRDLLSGLHADLLSEPLPEKMSAALRRDTPPPRQHHWLRAAASVVLLLAGSVAGWFAHETLAPPNGTPDFVRNAVGAHVVFTREKRHAVEVRYGKAKDEKHLVRWLSRRLGRPLNPPVLSDAGFDLVGGRLVADDGGPAAQFMYQDKTGNRLTLYIRSARDTDDTAFRIVEDRGVSAFYWIENPYAYALVGNVQRPDLVALGDLVYKHLLIP
jgi:anti-sigma factor RsiW